MPLQRFDITRREQGQAVVEMALVLPLLCLLVFGIVEFGRAFNYWIDTTHLANEAARFAAVDRNPSQSGQTLQQYIQGQATTSELKSGSQSVSPALRVCVSFPAGTSNPGDPVQVTATATYHWLRILGLNAATPIMGKATMRIETRGASPNVAAGCYPS
jgi:Flp pilus assembly protein TadG